MGFRCVFLFKLGIVGSNKIWALEDTSSCSASLGNLALSPLRVSEHIVEHGTAFFDAVAKRQVEGIVAKVATSQYVTGQRTKAWLKIKAQQRQQAVIGGFTIERGSRRRLGALLLQPDPAPDDEP